MPDQRSVMKEFRSLDQKRQGAGLSPQEEARYAQLRELVGSEEAGAGGPRPGFDVNAAAARLRDSLLPAGLRNRPPPEPERAAPPEPPEATAAQALQAAFDEQPFASLGPDAAPARDPYFDPASLDAEAAPQDPSSATGNDPGATWDPNAPGYDPDAPLDPNAAAYDPASAAYDPNAPAYDAEGRPLDAYGQPYDPNAQPWDPAAQGYDPAVAANDPNAPEAFDAGAQQAGVGVPGWEDGIAAAGAEPPQGGAPELDGFAENQDAPAAFDRSALDFGATALAGPDDAAQADEPGTGYAGASSPAGGAWATPGAEDAALDASARWNAAPGFGPEQEPGGAGALPAAPGEPAWGDPSAEAWPPPAAAEARPDAAPSGRSAPAASLGEYDADGGAGGPSPDPLEAMLPFDPARAAAIEPGQVPEGFETGAPLFEPETGIPAPSGLGDYDDTAAFDFPAAGGPGQERSEFTAAHALVPGASAGWQPEAALDDGGFALASEGSFSGAAPPADVPVPAAPPLDLDFDVSAAAPEAAPDLPVPPPPSAAVDDVIIEEIPTIDGEEILEEVPHPAAVAAPVLDALDTAAPPAGDAGPAPATSEIPAAEPPPEPSPPLAEEAAPVAPGTQAPATPEPPEPDFDVATEPEVPSAAPSPPSAAHVAGSHRVVVHTVEGQVKRGVLEDSDLDAVVLGLASQTGGEPEMIQTDKVKAIFFMLAPGEKPPLAEGKKVRVTFRDGRQVAGFSPDYREDAVGFFMIPADSRTNTGRIWVYQSAVRQVAVS